MVLWGVIDGGANEKRLASASKLVADALSSIDVTEPSLSAGLKYIPIAIFQYDIADQSRLQTFSVFPFVKTMSFDFTVMVLEAEDNWGSESSCLYRVKVHGNAIF